MAAFFASRAECPGRQRSRRFERQQDLQLQRQHRRPVQRQFIRRSPCLTPYAVTQSSLTSSASCIIGSCRSLPLGYSSSLHQCHTVYCLPWIQVEAAACSIVQLWL
ncbi:hypothetical protein SEVIR_1G287800v4 [Setaria viridis]|uniref:Uncharacterized protein n=1 Tax=Setaria viridis TaxID=4556 RepID=A0A4U6WE11_SETVI|nr:hypothetical protein SEVIR_1G287800v2 [Setaria viridis]